MQNFYNIFIIIIALVLSGCGSKGGPDLNAEASRKIIKSAPDWFLNPPQKEGFLTNAASATSQDMQMALDKARTAAELHYQDL